MLRNRPWTRRVIVALLLLFPWILATNWTNMANRASIFTLALLSLVVLTGWVGQISLAQGALMGVGAFSAVNVTTGIGLEFPFSAIVAGAAAALVASAIGFFALRIRGLYLAIATLGFQWALEYSFLEWHPFSGGFQGKSIDPLTIGGYDFSDDRLFFYLAWPTAILIMLMVANLRDSKTGRAWFAIRSSEVAAKTLGINVTRYKLIAFAVAGFIVGVAGSLNLNFVGTATPLDYNFQKSILYLSIAVLGGIGAIGGALVGAVAYIFTDQFIFTKDWFGGFFRGKIEILAAVLLIVTILQNPNGLIGAREHLAERRAERKARKERRAGRGGRREIELDATGTNAGTAASADGRELVGAGAGAQDRLPPPVSGAQQADDAAGASAGHRLTQYMRARGERTQRPDAAPLLQVEGITIRFGGVVANDAISYEVRPGEICGLIGPNGAGKTTNFNCVNGLLEPNSGSVRFRGRDITDRPTHERAGLGMARTFQLMRLFPRLSVLDNLLVGTHLKNESGFVSNLLMADGTRRQDRHSRETVQEVMSMLGIEQYADHRVAGLPFGVLRLVELGRALVTQPTLLLLDEPASGLDVTETDAFAEILFKVRDEIGHTILIIEHDMRLVMMACDYLYVLDFGKNLAEGFPSEIRNNAAVIAAYLGEEAVA